MSWKKTLSESEQAKFKRLWNRYVLQGKALHAFELYRMQETVKDKKFAQKPETEQIKLYKAYLSELGLVS